MKIEKGKLYYIEGNIYKSLDDTIIVDSKGIEFQLFGTTTGISNKIAVHCPTKEDWEYVVSKGYYLGAAYIFDDYAYDLYYADFTSLRTPDVTITIDQFKEFYPNIEALTGHKEQSDKLSYELDFNFITQLAKRMQTNKGKYEPYNWQKPINVDDLKQALFRHVIEVMNGNYKDEGRDFGHLEAIACNVMMINYQINNLEKQK